MGIHSECSRILVVVLLIGSVIQPAYYWSKIAKSLALFLNFQLERLRLKGWLCLYVIKNDLFKIGWKRVSILLNCSENQEDSMYAYMEAQKNLLYLFLPSWAATVVKHLTIMANYVNNRLWSLYWSKICTVKKTSFRRMSLKYRERMNNSWRY